MFGDESMDLSYYDKQNSKIVFPLLLDLYKQSCEQRAELKNEYMRNRSETTLKQFRKANRNSVQIYNKIMELYREKEKKAC